jgi:hypothetical protein
MKSTQIVKLVLLAMIMGISIGSQLFAVQSAQATNTHWLVKTAYDPTVYYINDHINVKKPIFNERVFYSYPNNDFSKVRTISQAELDGYDMIELIKTADNPSIYFISGNTKRLIPSERVFNSHGFNWNKVLTVNPIDLNSYTTGSVLSFSGVNTANNGSSSDNTLLVSIVNEDIPSIVIPSNVWHNFTKIRLESSKGESIVINGLTVNLIGLNSGQEVSEVYLTDGNDNQIGKPAIIKGKNATFRFDREPIVVPASGTKIIKIYASLKSDGIYAGFGIAGPEFIYTTNNVVGQFPINGFKYKVINGSAFSADVTIEPIKLATGIRDTRVGAKNEIITRFKFTESSNTQDVKINKIVLTKKGTIGDGDLVNIDLVKSNNRLIKTVKSIENGQIVFDLSQNPFLLESGSTETLTVRGDFVGGTDDEVQLVIENISDVVITGTEYNFRLLPKATIPIGGESRTYNQITLNSGSANAYIGTNNANRDVVTGAADVVLGKFTIKADGSTLNFNGFDLLINSFGDHELVGKITVQSGNEILAHYSARDFINKTRHISFDHDVTISGGQRFSFEIVGNIDDEANNLDSYKLTLNNLDLYTTSDHDDVGTNWKLESRIIGVKVSQASIAINPDYEGLGIIAGEDKQMIGSFELQVGAAEDLILNGATIEDVIAGRLSADNGYENIYFAINRRVVDKIEYPLSTSHIFSFKNYKLKKGKSYTLDIYADTTTEANNSNLQLKLTNLIIAGKDSGAIPKIDGLGTTAQGVTALASSISIDIENITSEATAGIDDQVIGRFTITNNSVEKIRIDELFLYELPNSDNLSSGDGFTQLKLVRSENYRKRVGRYVRNPHAGGNRLGGFDLKVGESIDIDVIIDTTEEVSGKTINLMIQDIYAYGKTSREPVDIMGDQLILGPVTFNVLD